MKVIIFLSLSRQGYPNGAPKLLTECDQGLELAQLFPLGLEVLINARRVRSDLIDLQATVVWPKFTEVPLYKLKPSKLDADEAKFHSLCSRLKKMTPICINGLPGTGSLNIWSAKVQEILDEDLTGRTSSLSGNLDQLFEKIKEFLSSPLLAYLHKKKSLPC